MQIIKSLFIIGCLSLSQALSAACTASWTGAGTDDFWADTSNWNSGCFPNGPSDTATFNSPTAPNTADLAAGSFDINTLTFDTTGQSYTLEGSNGILGFPNTGAGGLNVLSGSHTISDVTLLNDPGPGTIPVNILGQLTQNASEISADYLPMFVSGQWNTSGVGGIGNTTLAAQIEATLSGGGILTATTSILDFTNGSSGTTFTLEDNTTLILLRSSQLNLGTNSQPGTFNFVSGTLTSDDTNIYVSYLFNQTSGSFTNTNSSSFNTPNLNLIDGSIFNTLNSSFEADQVIMTGGAFFNDGSSSVNNNTFVQMSGIFTNDGIFDGSTYNLFAPGVVKGNGTIMAVFGNQGLVAPGDQLPGHLYIDEFTQASSGTLQINFSDDTTFGVLDTDYAFLGGTLDLEALPGFIPAAGKPYTIVTAKTSLDNTFDTINTNTISPYFDPHVSYLSDSVEVEFTNLFPGLLSPKEAIFSTQNQINFLLLRQIDRMLARGCCCCDCGFDAFIAPIASSGGVYRRGDFVGYEFNTAGILCGADFATSIGGIGFAFDYEHLDLRGKHRWGRVDIERFHGDIYGALHIFDSLYLNAIVGGGGDQHHFKRRELSRGLGFAYSKPTSREINALLGLEYALCVSDFTFVPFVDYQYGFFDLNKVHERADDSGFDLEFPYQRFESNRSILGFRLNSNLCLGGISLIPEINFAWEREFSNRDRRLVTTQPLALPAFVNPSTGRNTFMGGFDVEAVVTSWLSVDFSYEVEGNARYINNFFYLGFNGRF